MESTKVVVKDIIIKDLRPVLIDKSLNHLLPSTLFPQYIEFIVSPVSNAVSNAIRRTVACELLTIAMFAEYESLTTNEPFIIPEMVLRCLRMIPIDQKCPLDATFALKVVNSTGVTRDVKSGEIVITNPGKGSDKLKHLPFNTTFTLFTLQPGKSCVINDIGINAAYGSTAGDGMQVMAVNAAHEPMDQIPINTFEPNGGNGIPSRLSNPRVWKLHFNTNGSLPPKEIVVRACDNIIARVQAVQDLLYSIESNGDEYILIVPGQSHTIGNLFMRTISDLFPEIRAVTYSPSNIGVVCTLRVRCDEDINMIYKTTIKHLIGLFGEIKKYFE